MLIKPYGDTMNDGAVQLSFTLPIPDSAAAREAARVLVLKLGFAEAEVVHAAPLSSGFTFFVAYGRTAAAVETDEIAVAGDAEKVMSFDEVNDFIRREIGRKLIVVGACIGDDAHTVGIDAIMNMKGCNHHFGLERYPMAEAHNLGSQMPPERLIARAVELNADAILVSQVVTQKDSHIRNLTALIELLEAEHLREKFIAIAGGPHIDARLARELGYDTGFGKGTYAEHVASFIARRMAEKNVRGGRK